MARTESVTRKLADMAGNEHRWVDHGYLIENCEQHAQGCLSVAGLSNSSAAPARFERATPALGERCSIP
jgi:hypothetical protein